MNTTPLTQYQKDIIREYVADCLRDIARDGEIETEESIWVEDFGGLGEDCEIRVIFEGICHERHHDRFTPPYLSVDVNYDAEAAFYKRNSEVYLYSAPVNGRIIDTIS